MGKDDKLGRNSSGSSVEMAPDLSTREARVEAMRVAPKKTEAQKITGEDLVALLKTAGKKDPEGRKADFKRQKAKQKL